MILAAFTPTIRQGRAFPARVQVHPRGARGRSRRRPQPQTLVLVGTLTLTLSLGGCGGSPPAHAPLPSLPSAAEYLQAIRHDPTIRSKGVGDTTLLRAGRSACQLAESFNPDRAAYAALLLTVESSPHVSPTAYEHTLIWAARYLCPNQSTFVASTLKDIRGEAAATD